MTIVIERRGQPGEAFAAHAERGRERLTVRGRLLVSPGLRQAPEVGVSDGVLRVFNNALVFEAVSASVSVDFESVLIHAMARGDPTSSEWLRKPCIYAQLDSAASQEDDAAEQLDPFEWRFVPEDPSKLDPIFEEITACIALHPDKNMMDADDEGGDDWLMTADDFDSTDADTMGARQAALDHLESVFAGGLRGEEAEATDSDSRFEDAEEHGNANGNHDRERDSKRRKGEAEPNDDNGER
ncbi:regulator of volume decrease after cellular swelling-domain-containing protein [Chytriomyces sp. MP71]|nr:regulator of volume decrease after cellular swelling-domain-containing protein [Chytriomyces sp. MP71]